MKVTETISVDFGSLQRHGIYRDLAISMLCLPQDFPCGPTAPGIALPTPDPRLTR